VKPVDSTLSALASYQFEDLILFLPYSHPQEIKVAFCNCFPFTFSTSINK
jgi:hypothetical protein